MNTLITAFLLALITERITAALLAPVKVRWPDLDLWWVIYPAWVIGGIIAYLASINLLAELVPTFDPQVGRILTAVIVGGGANLLHDIFDRPPTASLVASSESGGTISATVRTETPPAAPAARR